MFFLQNVLFKQTIQFDFFSTISLSLVRSGLLPTKIYLSLSFAESFIHFKSNKFISFICVCGSRGCIVIFLSIKKSNKWSIFLHVGIKLEKWVVIIGCSKFSAVFRSSFISFQTWMNAMLIVSGVVSGKQWIEIFVLISDPAYLDGRSQGFLD